MCLLVALMLVLPYPSANAEPSRAEHAKITLDVTAKGETVTAFVDQTPPEHGKNPRPTIKAKEGEAIKIQYMLTNVYPHKTLENVVVESAIEMDFKPGAKAGSRMTLRAPKAGTYLIRIESRQTQSDHEHFAAVDLIVETEK
jgi:hypothetical protein